MTRAAEQSDVPALAQLLEASMRETFKVSWQGSAEALRRDGFGREFEIQVAVTGAGRVMGFTAWTKSYDLHHCITGGSILDLYVVPEFRAGVWRPHWSALSQQRFCDGAEPT